MRYSVPVLTGMLRERGFGLDSSRLHKSLSYLGKIEVAGEAFPVELRIVDPSLVDLPKIFLRERPTCLPELASHISPSGEVCYQASGTAFIDPDSPEASVVSCLDRAAETLGHLLRGDPLADAPAEFLSYWDGELVWLIDRYGSQAKKYLSWLELSQDDRVINVVSPATDAAIWEKAGYKVAPVHSQIAIVELSKSPSPLPGNWPPTSLRSTHNWLTRSDPIGAQRLRAQLEKFFRGGSTEVLIVFCHERTFFGILFSTKTRPSGKFQRAHAWASSLLSRSPVEIRARRITLHPADTTYLTTRNLDGQWGSSPLSDKRILLAGCGAIGSHLASLLAKLGAGSGRGVLTIVDNEYLLAANLGRHALGADSLFKNKAIGMFDKLSREWPQLNVIPGDCRIQDIRDLGKADIVIDATGEEAISHWLNEKFIAGELKALLFAYVIGAGSAAQVLLLDDPKQGCFRCRADREKHPFFPTGAESDARYVAGAGCDGYYTPFPVSAGLSAAILAVELILDWARHEPTPRMRHRDINAKQDVKNRDLPKRPGCPACGSQIG